MFGSLAGSFAARARHRSLRLVAVGGAIVLASLTLGSMFGSADAVFRAVDAGVLPIVSVAVVSDDEVVAQTETQTTVVDYGHRPVELAEVTVDDRGDRVKLVPRPGRADVVGASSLAEVDRVTASENGAHTPAATAGFEVAAERVLTSADLRDYLRADDPPGDGDPSAHDLAVTFDRPLTGDQYLVVRGRNGNSTLHLTALDESGMPFDAGRPLSIEPPYTWNTGYAPGDRLPAQPFHLAVIDVDELLAAAGPADGSDRPTEITGLRLSTDDGADVNVGVFVNEDTTVGLGGSVGRDPVRR